MTAAASGNALLDAHVRLIRDTADLVEASGIPGLVLCPDQDEIVIQVPQAIGDAAARASAVARLADLTGGTAAADPRPGGTQGWSAPDLLRSATRHRLQAVAIGSPPSKYWHASCTPPVPCLSLRSADAATLRSTQG